jgi:hypothetical protein
MPMCNEEVEVRKLLSETPHNKTADSTKRRMAHRQEGMALAMVCSSASKNGTPIFRALTPVEAMQTSTVGLLLYSNSSRADKVPAGAIDTSVLVEKTTQK